MAKKKTSKSSRNSSTSSKSLGNANNNVNVVLTAILILVVFQLIILFGILITQNDQIVINDEKINEIEIKVSKIDAFFASNVDGYGGSAPTGGSAAPTDRVNPDSIDIEGEPTLGSDDATVTIVEFSDYECPFCGRFFTDSFGQLKEEYIDTGKVKFVYKDFPLGFHPRAKPAAIAANCVQAQLGDEKYFEYHDMLFEGQTDLSESNLKAWAVDVGVSENEFALCLDDPEVSAEVDADLAEGTNLGVSGTPSFFINGNLIVGAQPYSVIKQAIETELQ